MLCRPSSTTRVQAKPSRVMPCSRMSDVTALYQVLAATCGTIWPMWECPCST